MIKTITKEKIKEKMAHREKITLIDVRDTPEYEKEHIRGAIHLLISEMTRENVTRLFHQDEQIITYSEDIDCPAKIIAAQKLIDFGFRRVLAYPGSWKEWKAAGYPVESGKAAES